MASNIKAVRQSLDVARPTRASQAKSRQSTMNGSVQSEQSVQGKLVQPRWNASTKISSTAKTADQKMKKFRKREEALVSHKSPSPGAWNCSDVSNHRTSPTRLSFSDLPTEILSQILGKLDPVSRLVTRNVSKTLRSIIDSEKPTIKCIELWEHPFGIQIRLLPTQRDVTFYQIENGCSVYWRKNETYVKWEHYIRLALQFLKPLLSNPKLKLVQFHAWLKENSSVSQKLFDLMSDVVKSNNTPFHVEKLAIFGYTERQLDSWLPLFKSGVLHNLRVVMKSERKVVNFLDSEHFKHAKSINFIPIGGLKPSFINHFLHFESFRIRLKSIPINDILRLMENLATSVIFKRCEFEVFVYLDLNEIEGAFEVLPAVPVKQGGLLYVEVHYVQFSLCFWFRKTRFMIERKLKEH